MSTPGQKIIEGLQEATRGDFAAVTIDGQRWVRSPAFEAMVEALEECDEADDIWLRMRAIEEIRPGKRHGIAIDDDDYAKAWRDLHRLLEDIWERRYAALALARGER